MAFLSLGALTQEVITNVGLVSGTSVQTYTEPQAELQVKNIFDFLFRKRRWDHLSVTKTYELDGTTGVVTATLGDELKEWAHILSIHCSDNDDTVPRAFNRDYLRVEGDRAKYWRPLPWTDPVAATKMIQFFPNIATVDVDIEFKVEPTIQIPDDIVPFPRDLVVNGASWLLLDTDGINPTNAAKCQGMFEQIYRDVVSQEGETPIGHGTRGRTGDFTVQTIS